jgi:hypothetical protein
MSMKCEARVIPKLSVLNPPIVRSYSVPHTDEFYRWQSSVQVRFAELKPHHCRKLAEYSFGMVLAQCCGLSSVVAHLALFLGVCADTLKARLRELYLPREAQKGSARSEFDHTLCFGPLLRWAIAGQPHPRLALALDPTNLGQRFTVLCVSVLYQGCGLPVAWAVHDADQKGSWNHVWMTLLGQLKDSLGEGYEVLVLTDRGLASTELFQTITELGWHPLMRVNASGHFRPQGWAKGYPMGQFAAEVGRRYAGVGVAFPTGQKQRCTLLASWEEGHEEAWLILTDLPACGTDVAWYAWRMWCEQGYRAIKRGQWQWQRTQMTDSQRAARLWAVVALVSMWAIDVGSEAEAADLPKVARERVLSLLKLGLMMLRMALIQGQPMPMPSHRLGQHPWPPRAWLSDPLSEFDMKKC